MLTSVFRFRERAQFSDVPLEANYKEANNVVSSIWQLSNIEGGLDEQETEHLLKTAQSSFVSGHRSRMALNPIDSFAELAHVLNRNGTAQATMERRSQEWFDEHGAYKF